MLRFFRIFSAWLLAAALAGALGAALSTQVVLGRLEAAGAGAIDLATRLASTWASIAGLAPLYAALTAVPLALGFLLASLARRPGVWRIGAFKLAGAAAVLATLFGLQLAFPAQPISGATGALGLFLQAVAGAVSGAVFAVLTGPQTAARSGASA